MCYWMICGKLYNNNNKNTRKWVIFTIFFVILSDKNTAGELLGQYCGHEKRNFRYLMDGAEIIAGQTAKP